MMSSKEEKSSKNLDSDKSNENQSSQQEELYWKWRTIQREQLGVSGNLYMIFASAILGFLLNLMLHLEKSNDLTELLILSFAVFYLVFSLLSYGVFTFNRLNDFRKTAQGHAMGKYEKDVSAETRKIGVWTWSLYYIQICFLSRGFILSVIGILVHIYF